MLFTGQVLKMSAQIGTPIQYFLNLSGDLLQMNQLFNKKLRFKHVGYQCVSCGNEQKIFRMGFCKKCFFESPYASESIIRPELSTAHLGTEERDIAVEEQIQLVPHIVYLAYTGEVKVGVTREKQVPTRWIDQGATFALEIARTKNRYEAGMIEVEMKKHVSDKTNWRKMLQDEFEDDIDLEHFRDQVKELFPEEFQKFYTGDEKVWKLDYPYTAQEKIASLNLEKTPLFTGKFTNQRIRKKKHC